MSTKPGCYYWAWQRGEAYYPFIVERSGYDDGMCYLHGTADAEHESNFVIGTEIAVPPSRNRTPHLDGGLDDPEPYRPTRARASKDGRWRK